MGIAIFGSYSDWNDGMVWKDFSERGEDLVGVVNEAAARWFSNKEDMIIEAAIGVDLEEVRLLVNARYNELIEAHKRKQRIETLKTSIRHCEEWLSNRDAESIRLTQLLADNLSELKELTV